MSTGHPVQEGLRSSSTKADSEMNIELLNADHRDSTEIHDEETDEG